MPGRLEDLAKEITIEEIKKMNLKERAKYYCEDWLCNIVLWPGWIGGPAGIFANLYITRNNNETIVCSPASIFKNVLIPCFAGAAIASAMRVGYHIVRDYVKIKNGK